MIIGGTFRLNILRWLVLNILLVLFEILPAQNKPDGKIYKVGVPNVPGLFYTDETGKIHGFSAEIFEQAAKDENLVFEWVFASWPQLFEDLKSGKIDALLSTQVTDDRKNYFDFLSNPLYTMWSELYIAQNSIFSNLTDLNGKSIGLVTNDNNGIGFEKYIQGFNLSFNRVYFNSHNEALLALLSGQLYAVAGPSPTFMNMPWDGLKSSGLYFNPTNINIAFPKDKNPEFRNIIDRRIAMYKENPNSVYNQLYQQYKLSEYKNTTEVFPRWVKMAFILLILTVLVVVVFVIVLRKQVQLKTIELIQREQNLRETLNAIGDGVITTDQHGNIINMSHVAQQLTNCPLELAQQSQPHEVFSFVDPKASVKVLYPVMEVLKTQKPLELPSRMVLMSRFSQEKYHISGSASPIFDGKGELIGVIVVFQDITEIYKNRESLRENEIYMRKILELGLMGTWSYEIQVKKYEWSDELYKMLGYTNNLPITPAFLDQIIHPDDLERVNSTMRNGIECRENYESVFRVKTQNDTYLYVKSIGLIALNEQQKPEQILGIMQNITSQKIYEQELIVAKEKAEESERLKSAFLANMSHEIRTPLNAIIGFTELMLQENVPADKRKHFARIVFEQNNLLLNLINDVIDIAKIESGSIDLNIQPQTDVLLLIDEVYNSLNYQCPSGIKFIKGSNNYQIECKLDIDPLRVKQILNNFIINAFKYTRHGIVELGYRLNFIHNAIEIYVRDTGIGIDKDMQARIFERFSQLDQMAQGAGLGLAISKSLAELMGGEINLTSEPGLGSEFTLKLPLPVLSTLANMNTVNIMPDEEVIDVDGLDLSSVNVLIAEDMDSNFMLLENLLLPKGANISRAFNGVEALTKVQHEAFDLIMMDIKMPLMDGLEATRQIRQMKNTVPIIAVTAYAFDTDRYKAIEMGCTDYISKPIDSDELMETIFRVLNPV